MPTKPLSFALLTAVVVGSVSASAQAPDRPKPTPAATPKPRPLIADSSQLIDSGSFEMPKVKQRTPARDLPKLVTFWQGDWQRFMPNAANAKAEVESGVTPEAAYTGKQALYVDFKNARTPGAGVDLATVPIPIKPSKLYRATVWAKLDPKTPIIIDQRVPTLAIQMEFFQADGETQAGDTATIVQPIPGTVNRSIFFTDRWVECAVEATSPAEAAFVRATWSIAATPNPGETNGVIYLDHASIVGERVEPVEDAPEPEPGAPSPGTPAAPVAPANPLPKP